LKSPAELLQQLKQDVTACSNGTPLTTSHYNDDADWSGNI